MDTVQNNNNMTSLIDELRTLLVQVCEGKQAVTTAEVVKLEDNLFFYKKRMIDLLDDLPKNTEHRALIQSGKKEKKKLVVLVFFFTNTKHGRQSNY